MNYPTNEEIESADRITLARWRRFLPSPSEENLPKLNRILERLAELGGMTPEIPKEIGW